MGEVEISPQCDPTCDCTASSENLPGGIKLKRRNTVSGCKKGWRNAFFLQVEFSRHWAERNYQMDTDLATRVDAVESQLGRWKIIVIVLLVVATVFVVAAAAPPQDNGFVQQVAAPKLTAQVFLLVGKDGKTYGRFYTKGNQPVLEFYDSKGAVIWSEPPSRGGFKPVQAK
jgi:hypothetical protein